MKDNRKQFNVLEERSKSCKKFPPEFDPLKIFVDSPVYREEQIADQDVYKNVDLNATTPFGELFQQEKQFEEDVFEAESPLCEKFFTQSHPLFGDFGIKIKDPREKFMVESPEFPNPDALDDLDRELESPECVEPVALDDPEEFADEPFIPASAEEEQPQTVED